MSVNKYTTQGGLQTLANGSRIWVGTKANYEAARQAGTMPTDVLVAITDDEQQAEATQISYDNTDSSLIADNVQDAIDELSNHKSIKYVHVFSGYAYFDDGKENKALKIISNSNANHYVRCSGILLLIDDWLYFNGCVGDVNVPSGSHLMPGTCSISSADSALSNLQWDPDWVDSLTDEPGQLLGCGYFIWGGPIDVLTPVKGTLNLTTMSGAGSYTSSTTKVYFCGKVISKT